MNETGGNDRFRQVRTLSLVLTAAPVLIGIALYFVLGTAEDGMSNPPLWIPVGQVAYAVAALAVAETLGFRTPAADFGEPQEVGVASVTAFRAALILRYAICDSLMILSIAAAFVVQPNTFVVYLIGGALSMALMIFEVLPSQRILTRTEASLEREGRPSYLREALGLR